MHFRLGFSARQTLVAGSGGILCLALAAVVTGQRPAPPTPLIDPPRQPTSRNVEPRKPVVRTAPVVAEAASEQPSSELPVDQKLADGQSNDVRPASFQDVTPGETSVDQVRAKLGKPMADESADGMTTLVYHIGPFPRVEFHAVDNVVSSIVVMLQAPLPAAEVAKELALDTFQPVPVPNQQGKLLGQAYPERGVLFSFADNPQQLHIQQILLEPISAEPFILRAMYDFTHNYRQVMADLARAAKIDPSDPRSYWLKAKTLSAMKRFEPALTAAQEAYRLAPRDAAIELTLATALHETGDHDAALERVRKVLADDELPQEVGARAECLLGDLLASGSAPDYAEAAKHHQQAITLAAPLVREDEFEVRRSAKRIVIDAHVGMAIDIAWGDWQRKKEVVPKWLKNARELAETTIETDHGHPELRLFVLRKSLEAYAGLKGDIDPAVEVQELTAESNRLIEQAIDSDYKFQLKWELGEALFDALRIENDRQNLNQSLKHAATAIELIENAAEERNMSDRQQHFIGRLCFTIGTIYALGKKDHQEAIAWYNKALPRLQNLTAIDAGRNGQRLVSMGVSYWHTGDRERALKISQEGVDLVEAAVNDGLIPSSSLSVPYRNLATIHRQLGHKKEATELLAKAEKLAASNVERR